MRCRSGTSRRSRPGWSSAASPGASEPDLLHGFCLRCREAGLDLSRALTIIDTLHPVYEGRVFRWRNDGVAEDSDAANTAAPTRATPPRPGSSSLVLPPAAERRGRAAPAHRLRRAGTTSPIIAGDEGRGPHRLSRARPSLRGARASIGEMDCVYSPWSTRHPDGFTRRRPRRAAPPRAGAGARRSRARRWPASPAPWSRSISAATPASACSSGRIQRGVADRIDAVLWFSDLRGFTTITDTAPPGEIIPLLNDYADAVIIGDPRGRRRRAEADRRRHARDLPRRRSRRGLPLRAEGRGRRCGASVAALNERRGGEGRADDAGLSRPAYRRGASTAISAASTGSTSRWWGPPSTRRAASPRCAARSTGRC